MKSKNLDNFEILDHTADIKVKVKADSLKQLFQEAASCMFSLMVCLEDVKAKESTLIKIKGSLKEDLLIDWLNELLYESQSKGKIFSRFLVQKLNSQELVAKARGERINRKRHRFKSEIKAATYYDLVLRKNKNSWSAQIVFDV